jgi:hypothetical protein
MSEGQSLWTEGRAATAVTLRPDAVARDDIFFGKSA